MAATGTMHITVTLDDLPEIKNLIVASELYFECLSKLGDHDDVCTDARIVWESAVISFQESRDEREASNP